MNGARLGQLQDLLGQLGPGLMYVKLTTPLGVATVDPFAPPDPTATAIMKALGISVTVGVGPVPASEAGDASLARNLTLGASLAVGGLAYLFRPKMSTLVIAGAAALLLNAGSLSALLPSSQSTEVAA